jgi:hypothetical protein
MSKQSDQTLVMLATIAGCLETLRATNSFARVDIRRAIVTGYEAACSAVLHWPGFTNRPWIEARRERFQRFIMAHPDRGYSAAAICCMCERLITDLVETHGHNRQRLAMLQPVADASRIVHDFCDRDGRNFVAYEKGDELLDELYRIIELRELV